VYSVVNPVTFRVWLSRQCNARPAVNGKPSTRVGTSQFRLRRTPEGRARTKKQSRSSAASGLLERQYAFPASPALRPSAFRLAERYRTNDGVHWCTSPPARPSSTHGAQPAPPRSNRIGPRQFSFAIRNCSQTSATNPSRSTSHDRCRPASTALTPIAKPGCRAGHRALLQARWHCILYWPSWP